MFLRVDCGTGIVDKITCDIVDFGIWLVLSIVVVIFVVLSFFISVYFAEIARNLPQNILFFSLVLFVFYLIYSPESFGVEIDDSADSSFGPACCGTIMFVVIPLSLVMRKYNYRKDRLEAEEKGLFWNDWFYDYIPSEDLENQGWNENWEWNSSIGDWVRNAPDRVKDINPENLEAGTKVMVRYILCLDKDHIFDTEAKIVQKNDDGSYEVEFHSSLWDKVDEKLQENVDAFNSTAEDLRKDINYKQNINHDDEQIFILASWLKTDYWHSLFSRGSHVLAKHKDGNFYDAWITIKKKYGVGIKWSVSSATDYIGKYNSQFGFTVNKIITKSGGTPNVTGQSEEAVPSKQKDKEEVRDLKNQ